jgi:HEAT repeat protein/energy-coupling factor transporter ATP-binding protein EcfA2
MSPDSWSLDLVSLVIGFLLAFLLFGLAYRYRARIARYWSRARERANRLRQRFTANMAARYSASAIEAAQTMHLLGGLAPLDAIYVETQLHAPLTSMGDEKEPLSLSPLQALQANERLSLIGPPGSGRTTLLNHLLLLQASQVYVTGESERVPVYVYLPLLALEPVDAKAVDTNTATQGAPIRLLVQSALSPLSRPIATAVTGWLQHQVQAGNALLLLDGWDEVASTNRTTVTAWLRELATACPGNRLVVTAGERGYAPLIEAGFVPLRPAPWTQRQLTALAQNWMAAWPSPDGDQQQALPAISCGLTPPTPLEATLQLAIQLRGQTPAATPAARMAQVLDLLLPPPAADKPGQPAWPPETGHRALAHLAFASIEQGRSVMDRPEIQSAVTQAMPQPQFALDEGRGDEADKAEQKAAREERERRTLQIVDCCRALTVTGAPIRALGHRRYRFTHPLIAAYLAAHHLAATGTPPIAPATDPAWLDLLCFYAGLAPPEPLLQQLQRSPDDLFLSHLWRAAKLLAAAPPASSPWRDSLMKRLAQLLMNPRMPQLFRDRALAALVESRQAAVGLLFKTAAASPDPGLRTAALLGLGALGREQDLSLIKAALDDALPEVRLAAVRALYMLAHLGSKRAMELLMLTMLQADGQVQRVVAESMAELGAEGEAVLRDGIKDPDLMVRRAAAYGLAATAEPWAREMLDKIEWEDKEWLVRNAAAEARASMQGGQDKKVPPFDLALPRADAEPWLISWATERGATAVTPDVAWAALTRALTEGDVHTRRQAVRLLGRLADPTTIDALRHSLRDPEPSIRQAALVALEEISRRYDMTIRPGG